KQISLHWLRLLKAGGRVRSEGSHKAATKDAQKALTSNGEIYSWLTPLLQARLIGKS
ncbi:MAG: hypothetical protein EORIYHIE_002434, partial [Candidatus Fervidibacter sp.]